MQLKIQHAVGSRSITPTSVNSRIRRVSRRSGLGRLSRLSRAVFEILETRQMMSVDVVNSTADSGAGSLRQVISAAVAGDTIQFSPGLDGQTITLSSGPLEISKGITIAGPGASSLTISGGGASSVFLVDGMDRGSSVFISGLTLTNGNANDNVYPFATSGGAIDNEGVLTLTNSNLTDNTSSSGGAIYNDGALTLSTSTA